MRWPSPPHLCERTKASRSDRLEGVASHPGRLCACADLKPRWAGDYRTILMPRMIQFIEHVLTRHCTRQPSQVLPVMLWALQAILRSAGFAIFAAALLPALAASHATAGQAFSFAST